MKQESFSDMEYRCRKKKMKREEFLEIMDEIIPWDEWVGIVRPYYPVGKRGRPPIEIEIMLRIYLLHFRHLLEEQGIGKLFFDAIDRRPGRLPRVSDNAIDWERYIENHRSAVR